MGHKSGNIWPFRGFNSWSDCLMAANFRTSLLSILYAIFEVWWRVLPLGPPKLAENERPLLTWNNHDNFGDDVSFPLRFMLVTSMVCTISPQFDGRHLEAIFNWVLWNDLTMACKAEKQMELVIIYIGDIQITIWGQTDTITMNDTNIGQGSPTLCIPYLIKKIPSNRQRSRCKKEMDAIGDQTALPALVSMQQSTRVMLRVVGISGRLDRKEN